MEISLTMDYALMVPESVVRKVSVSGRMVHSPSQISVFS